jgi:outer membrane lipoprotein-sorting protein
MARLKARPFKAVLDLCCKFPREHTRCQGRPVGTSWVKTILLLAVLAVLHPAPLSAQTAEEVVAKSIEARGGVRKIKSVETLRFTGRLTLAGMDGTLLVEMKRPGKMREEAVLDGKSMIRTTDGHTGWVINQFLGKNDPEPLSEDELKTMAQQADFDRPIVDYQAKGYKIELVGHEKLEDKDTYKLKVTLKDGQVRYDYIGAASFLELKWEGRIVRNGEEFQAQSLYRDYRSVEGLMFPFTIESDTPETPNPQKIVFDKIEINPPIDDVRFGRPEPVPGATGPQ